MQLAGIWRDKENFSRGCRGFTTAWPRKSRLFPLLSHELRQKLQSIRPRTIGQASRIDGMTPVALTLLVAYVRWNNRRSVF
jgi:hypothetical protein